MCADKPRELVGACGLIKGQQAAGIVEKLVGSVPRRHTTEFETKGLTACLNCDSVNFKFGSQKRVVGRREVIRL